jgi:hypothetical protein
MMFSGANIGRSPLVALARKRAQTRDDLVTVGSRFRETLGEVPSRSCRNPLCTFLGNFQLSLRERLVCKSITIVLRDRSPGPRSYS